MPRRNRTMWKALLPLGLLVVAVLALVRRGGDDWEYEQAEPVTDDAPTVLHAARRRPAARFALVAAFTTLFFAGASFTAGAGDQMARLLDNDAAVAELGAAAEPAAAVALAEEAPATEPAAADPAAVVELTPEDTTPEVVLEDAAGAAPAPETAATEAADPEIVPEHAASAARTAPDLQAATAEQEASNLVGPAPAEPSTNAETSTPAAAKPVAPRQPTNQWVVKRAAVAPADRKSVV